ncbi:MAG: response regulator transcription factor [bacterium]
MTQSSALVVEDDPRTAEVIRRYLESDGFTVRVAIDGQEALTAARLHEPDVILLDVMVPQIDGITVCRRIRAESDVAILMVTARTNELDILDALSNGADDYVTKPFRGRELVARVRAVLRRTRLVSGKSERPLEFGPLTIDPRRHEARIEGSVVDLTRKEFLVLHTLAANAGKAFTRGELVEAAFGMDYEGLERSVDVHVRNIRKKIERDPEAPDYLHTLYGVGYRFQERIHVA